MPHPYLSNTISISYNMGLHMSKSAASKANKEEAEGGNNENKTCGGHLIVFQGSRTTGKVCVCVCACMCRLLSFLVHVSHPLFPSFSICQCISLCACVYICPCPYSCRFAGLSQPLHDGSPLREDCIFPLLYYLSVPAPVFYEPPGVSDNGLP